MIRRFTVRVLAGFISTFAIANESVTAAELTAEQIVGKNAVARGGMEAWRKIQSMVWLGNIESAHAPVPSMPFVLEMKRPNKMRFEITLQNQVSVRMYDGTHGWKMRPSSSGKPELQPYTNEELDFARNNMQGIEGPFVDDGADGLTVTLDGVDDGEGHRAYRLKIKWPSGASRHVWIDAQTFLDVKYDREFRNVLGRDGTMSVFYRNYKTIDGVQMPLMIESGADSGKATDKMVIDRIELNSQLADVMFAKPNMPARQNAFSARSDMPQTARSARFGPPQSVPGLRGAR